LEITKTVLSLILILILITILTSLTTIAAYAGGDGNGQKAEDDSSVGISDCDDNEVEQAGFDCIAIAASEIEPPEEGPPEESATLSVCKEVTGGTSQGFEPDDFTFTVTGNGPSDDEFAGDNSDGCVDVTIGPGEYAVSEVSPPLGGRTLDVRIEGDCEEDPNNQQRATGEIQAGETQECRFINSLGD
jgi:hypothetical protein